MIKKSTDGGGPVAEWLSSQAPLRRPRVLPVQIPGTARTRHRSSGRVEAASHMPQLEGPSTKIDNYVMGGIGGEKSGGGKKKTKTEDWQQALAL